jgi:uncharacterized SAM-binding protein YcdF (DUF218 family)
VILGADLVRYLLSSTGVIVVFFVGALWITAAARASRVESLAMRKARQSLLLCAIAFSLLSIYGLQVLVARAIVGSLKPFAVSDAVAGKRTAIVILGSGTWHVEDWDGRMATYPDDAAASRVLEAARVFRMIDPTIVISSGGNPHPRRETVPAGEGMRDDLIRLGVPADRIQVETSSQTTRDEAVIVEGMLKTQSIEQLVVVTSETHMRRSMAVFRSVGLHPIPAMAMEFLRGEASWADLLLPSEHGLRQGAENAHELIGMMYYRLRGWHK